MSKDCVEAILANKRAELLKQYQSMKKGYQDQYAKGHFELAHHLLGVSCELWEEIKAYSPKSGD